MLVLALCCFAFIAGFVDAVVGGGGLVQLPAMFVLQPQLTLVQTLATNKTANFTGTLVAAIKYIRRV
ncbi:MAG TPA: TSUP family transporter, partial [Flavipsychrobacter sp.]|nr:TSUP family transporter [Flavipsychrobacter sp.]